MASPTLPFNVSTAYQQLVVEHLHLVAKVYTAISYFNMGEAQKAQESLQLAIADIERSH